MSSEMTAAEALEAVRNATIYHSKRYPMPTTLMPDGGGYFIDDAVFDGLVAALPALRAAVEERDALRSELARVRAALEYHGRHGERCARVFNLVTHADMCRGVRAPECNCGFAAAQRGDDTK